MTDDPYLVPRLLERSESQGRRLDKVEDAVLELAESVRVELRAMENRLKEHTEKTINGKIAAIDARYYLVRVVVFGFVAIILTALGGWLVTQWTGGELRSPGSLYRRSSGPEY